MTATRPTFIFDGDCGICRTWVDYWRRLTGDSVDYRPYQQAAADFPAIPVAELERASQLVLPDGEVLAGAAATFRLLSLVPGRGGWWWAYRHVPGFAPLAVAAYGFLSTHRGLLAALTRALWGRRLEPESYALVSWLFLRGLGFIYLAAFLSLVPQIRGLVGAHGILPLGEYFAAAREGWGTDAYWRLPSLFWLNTGDAALMAGAWAGVALSAILILGRLERIALAALFALYLSFIYAGQLFMSYQWDMLLTETGFLAIFLTGGSRVVIWLYRLLLFRFLFLAGLVKLASGDPTWRELTALDYHFFTQPLPSPLAWYAAQLPHWLLTWATALTLAIEIAAVVLIVMPRRPRMVAALLVAAFQLGIMLTGSYNWFNLLTVLLALLLLDDQAVRRLLPSALAARIVGSAPRPGRFATGAAMALAVLVVPLGINSMYAPLTGRNLPLAGELNEAVAPFLIVNPYGLFATVTTTRPVMVIETSDDNAAWTELALPFLPGPVARAPTWNIPYQPRLDWQLWFASYGSIAQSPWIERLLQRLLDGSPEVAALFADAGPARKPPRYVRVKLFDYRFTLAHPAGGAWWTRREDGLLYPAVSLGDFRRGAP